MRAATPTTLIAAGRQARPVRVRRQSATAALQCVAWWVQASQGSGYNAAAVAPA
jgi:hypothetical protein